MAREAQIRNDLAAEIDAPRATAPGPAVVAPAERVAWLDIAKGLGIVAVVIGHTLGGLIDVPHAPVPAAFRAIFLALYIVHMPLFFLLAGLLVSQRIARSARRFGVDLLRSIVWPYFLWSTAQYSVIFVSGSLVNAPVTQFWRAIARLPVATVSQFWFLYVLFFLHLAALILLPRLGRTAFLALALAGKIVPAVIALPALPRLFLTHGGFYALGVWLGLAGLEHIRVRLPRLSRLAPVSAVLALAVVALAAFLTIVNDAPFWARKSSDIAAMAWRLPTVPASLLGIAAAILVAMALRGRIAAAFAYLGRASMAIFVLHVMFVAGIRIVLVKLFHQHDPVILLAFGVTAGFGASLLCYVAARRLGLSRLLGLGA